MARRKDEDASGPDESMEKSPEQKIVGEAKKRFQQCVSWESEARKRYDQDIRFANADADNGWQWPDDIRNTRIGAKKPCLTINKVRQHNLQIINDAKQNKPSVKIKPVGNGATADSAEVFEGVVRHIEYISNAQAAYDHATTTQVQGGIGYIRIVTDYANDDSFDQEIFIRRVVDPMTVYLDPDIKEADGSDARFAFIFDDMDRDEFNEAYPEYKDRATTNPLGNDDGWSGKDKVRVAEYYRRTSSKNRLVAFTDPQLGVTVVEREDKLRKRLQEAADGVIDAPDTKFRDIVDNKVEWFLIVGNEIVQRRDWLGVYIPIVRVIGEETIIDGKLDRKGHTRAMKDPQRMYNYNASAQVEFGALQTKTPWIGPKAAFEGSTNEWRTANTENWAYLTYNHVDSEGNPIPPPQREQPPSVAPAFLSGMQTASDELRAVSGQWQAEMGQPSNERSGIAIQQRQRQGDNATYHFIDNLALAIRFIGKILIDLIPKVYDTPRVIKILADDGTESEVQVDPKAAKAYIEQRAEQAQQVRAIFNPSVGRYDVEADVGPAFATKRQEAFQAFTQIAANNPKVMEIAGDLIFKAADFPMADELADRLRRMVPPAVLGEGPSPAEQELQQRVGHMQGLLANLVEQLAEEKRKVKDKAADIENDAYGRVTDRMKVVGAADPQEIAAIAAQLVVQALTNPPGSVEPVQTPPEPPQIAGAPGMPPMMPPGAMPAGAPQPGAQM